MARQKGLSFYKKKKKVNFAILREVFIWLFGMLASAFIAIVLVYFMGMMTNVVGVSMEPTLYNGQRILVNRFIYVLTSPQTGDVVVFLPKGNENAHYYVKRVVAVPGDEVYIENGTLYVNNVKSEWMRDRILDPGIVVNPLVMERGEYFCVGDKINASEDSRSANVGPVQTEDIIGKAWFRFRCRDSGFGFVE